MIRKAFVRNSFLPLKSDIMRLYYLFWEFKRLRKYEFNNYSNINLLVLPRLGCNGIGDYQPAIQVSNKTKMVTFFE